MIEFWHDFLYDKDTFGSTIWIISVVLVLCAMTYFMLKETK